MGDADALVQTLVVKPVAPVGGKLLTWESGCRLDCASDILKWGAVVKALRSQRDQLKYITHCAISR